MFLAWVKIKTEPLISTWNKNTLSLELLAAPLLIQIFVPWVTQGDRVLTSKHQHFWERNKQTMMKCSLFGVAEYQWYWVLYLSPSGQMSSKVCSRRATQNKNNPCKEEENPVSRSELSSLMGIKLLLLSASQCCMSRVHSKDLPMLKALSSPEAYPYGNGYFELQKIFFIYSLFSFPSLFI